jgi:hypothetical protein
MVAWLVHLSKLEPEQYDLRNAAAVKLAKELLKGKDKYDLFIPLV